MDRAGALSTRYRTQRKRLPSHGLLFDTAGNLYGVATNDREQDGQSRHGLYRRGVAALDAGGTWTSQILYLFPDDQTTSSTNCEAPQSYLTIDSKGNLYGTCTNGGANGVGGVYELSPPSKAGGQWTQQLSTASRKTASMATRPGHEAGLILDAQGNLYGTTQNGGTDDAGVVFELSPGTRGRMDGNDSLHLCPGRPQYPLRGGRLRPPRQPIHHHLRRRYGRGWGSRRALAACQRRVPSGR